MGRLAIDETSSTAKLVMGYQTGITPAGSPVIRRKWLKNVKANASDQAIYDVAEALFSLVDCPLLYVELRRNGEADQSIDIVLYDPPQE